MWYKTIVFQYLHLHLFFSERYWFFSGVLNLAPALATTSKGSEYSLTSLELEHGLSSAWLRHFEFLSIFADHLRLQPQADHQGNNSYTKSCIKATDALN